MDAKARRQKHWVERVLDWIGLLLLALLVWCLIIQIPWPFRRSVVISPETTYLIGPIGSDGRIDYEAALREWQSCGVTEDNNAAKVLAYIVVLWNPAAETAPSGKQPCLRHDTEAEWPTERWLEDLVVPGPDELARIRQWVGSSGPALALACEASRRPRWLVHKDRAELQSTCRLACLLLAARATLRGREEQAAAWEDILAVHRLARLLLNTNRYIARHVEAWALGAARLAVPADLPAERARRMLADLDALPTWTDVRELFEHELRFYYLDAATTKEPLWTWRVGVVAKGYTGLTHGEYYLSAGLSRTKLLRELNQAFNELRPVLALPTHQLLDRLEELEARKRQETQFDEKAAILRMLFCGFHRFEDHWLSECLIWNARTPEKHDFSMETQVRMRFQLARLALALAAWRAEKGGYPETLSQLAPDYLKEVPIDLFTGRPLAYRREGDGYLLYSVGMNRRDDGGVVCGEKQQDDLVVRASR
ncbi:MAG: hypothetical protein BWX88_00929 [Planctomycetes bacterium ADurb.Bin126]|nr:MAG: hypothetical protein BWX88_00929 [Planctomycetes bacterium ADurb.Bin126]HOD82558.1 hypothetical protein [Phycisphaerae bacterium]HQL73295.1 hypothetical protein [Phycisphaerae bacterium]